MKDKLKVGDSIWVVQRWRNRPGHAAEIVKVGRRYLYTKEGYKVNRECLEDGFAIDDNRLYYPSEKGHVKKLQEINEGNALMERMRKERPTLEQIQAIKALMGWK